MTFPKEIHDRSARTPCNFRYVTQEGGISRISCHLKKRFEHITSVDCDFEKCIFFREKEEELKEITLTKDQWAVIEVFEIEKADPIDFIQVKGPKTIFIGTKE